MKEKLCPICKYMGGGPGPKYNVHDMSFHLRRHDKDSLIYLITEDLLRMKQ